MKRYSLRSQLAARFAAAVALGLIAVSLVSYFAVRASLDRELAASLLNVASIQAASVTDAPGGRMVFHEWELTPAEAASVRDLNRYAQVWSAAGESLLRTRYITEDLPLDTAALRAAAAGQLIQRDQVFQRRPIRSLFYPLERLGALHAHHVLQVAAPMDARNRMLSRLATFLVALTALVTAATLGGGWWLARRSVRPVLEITDEAEAIGAGTLQRRIQASAGAVEYERLVAVLNTMLDRLEGAFNAQRRFIGDASHELRSPLTALRGELELARRRERSPQEYQRTIDSALEEVDRLSRVTEDLLTLARADAGVMRARRVSGDLGDTVAAVAERIGPHAAAAGVRIELDRSVAVRTLAFDHDLIERAIWNLLDNAIRHSPRGGLVRVTIRSSATGATITVSDEGAGVAAEERERIFDRFYRVDPSRTPAPAGGTGLGLAIVQSIARAHGGHVAVVNGGAPGATFEFAIRNDPEPSRS